MKHLKKGRKFGRTRNQRRALMKSLASSFFMRGRIQTTEARAKELRPFAEKIITRARHASLADRRILARIFSEHTVKEVIRRGSGVGDRPGGYTRIIKTGARKSDAARMAILEMVE